MRKILILFSLFVANMTFGQQISVQNNELKYRITGGTIKTAADKTVFQSKVDALSSRIVADSSRLNSEITRATNKENSLSSRIIADSTALITGLALKANIASPTFTGTVTSPALILSSETASTIASFDASKNLKSLSTSTYPSLTELSYVKGVTSAIQTQIGAKFTTPSGLTTNTISKWNGTTYVNSTVTDNGTMVTIPTLSVTNDAVINGNNIGYGGGNISTNLRVGTSSLSANTTGANNTAIGTNSLSSSTIASSNTAIGRTSLTNLVSGDNNVSLGAFSARWLGDGTTIHTISNSSVFLGAYARPLLDNQTNQIAIGFNAPGLGSNTTVLGNSSTTFGRWWGNFLLGSSTNSGEMLQVTGTSKLAGNTAVTGTLTTSADVVANGVKIGRGATVTNNTAVGENALNTTNSGSNVALGSFSLQQSLGSGNAAVGRSSLGQISSGDNNTAIGLFAGRYISGGSTALTTSNNSIFIGGLTNALADNQINQIVIGYGTTGNGSNTTTIGNSSTTLTYLFGQVAGGSFKLHANNTAPSSSTATCAVGEIRIDGNYFYYCSSTNNWKRATLNSY